MIDLTLVWYLAGSLLVIALTYVATRWLAALQFSQSRGRRLRVLEGVAVGRDRQLLLVSVGNEVMLVGSAPGAVSLIARVEDPAAAQALLEEVRPAALRHAAEEAALSRGEAGVRQSLERMRQLITRGGGKPDA